MTATSFPSAAAMPSARTESARARILRDYGILDTEAERAFDDLTALASQVCDAPASIITFIDGDRLWFKSAHGLAATEAPVEHSFCAHAAGEPDVVFAIGNALGDDRFARNVFVMPADGLRAYAGANIVDASGVALGSICVVDFVAREFTDAQREALTRLSRQVVDQLQLRRRVVELERQHALLAASEAHREDFARVVAHDLRSPMLTQAGLLEAFVEDYADALPAEAGELLGRALTASRRGVGMLDGLMRYLREGTADAGTARDLDVDAMFRRLRESVDDGGAAELSFVNEGVATVHADPVALEHILLNLISNALKYLGRPDGRVRVRAAYEGPAVQFCVIDNGPGIPAAEREQAFRLFARASTSAGTSGSGLGLALASRLAVALGGRLDLRDGEGGAGCHFTLRLPA